MLCFFPCHTMNNIAAKFNLRISVLNVNSLNISTIGLRNAKTYLKIEGATEKRADVILLCDIRAKSAGDEVKKIFNLTMNGSYKLYLNSTRDSRGVGIAIRRNIAHEIKNMVLDGLDENYLLMDLVIKDTRITIGVVYGPNENNIVFYSKLREELERLSHPFIIGGDFNTILCTDPGVANIDRKGDGRVPNPHNSRAINNWIRDGFAIDPFRALYPFATEVSTIPFRSVRHNEEGVRYVHNRLDFYLVSQDILGKIDKIVYEDRLGSDFDHKEVTLHLGRKSKVNRLNIFNSTLKDLLSDDIGTLAVYETLDTHLTMNDMVLRNSVTQLDMLIREKVLMETITRNGGANGITRERMDTNNANIRVVRERLPHIDELMTREYTCDYRQLYEVVMMNLKNRLVSLQKQRVIESKETRETIILRIRYMESKFGAESMQAADERDKLLRFDDINLKERATKFRDFLDVNNEKATKAFCRLSKEGEYVIVKR